MILFNELRITPDGKTLIIDASIEDLSYYRNMTIDSIIIDTQDTYISNGPSSNPIYTYQEVDQTQNARITLTTKDLNTSLCGSMFFVYVTARGTPSPDTPCDLDNSKTLGTVINLFPIYEQTLQYLKEINNECNIPKGFIDMTLRLKSIELCVRTGNYPQAIRYWNKFFKNISYISKPNNKCGCYG